jgi:phage anti-repressor protein
LRKEIDRFKNYYPQQATKYKLPQDISWWTISLKGNIYVGNTERGYEISVYDLDGRPIRRIRKEFIHVPVPDEIKEKALGSIPEDHPLRRTLYFADHMSI